MLKKILNFGRARLNLLDEHTLEVLKKSFSSTLVKVAGMLLGLGLSVFLGRTIGSEGLGIINLSNRIVNILIIFGLFGMRSVIVKEVAIAKNNNNYSHIGNVLNTAYWLNGGITIIISLATIFFSSYVANNIFHEPKLAYPLVIAVVVMTPQVFSRIFSSSLVGFRKIWQSNLVEQTLSIGVTLAILLSMWMFKKDISIIAVAISYGIGRLTVTISVWIYWKILFKYKAKRKFLIKSLSKVSFPLFISTLSTAIIGNFDTIILGIIGEARDVGLYTVALSIALLTSFLLQVTDAAVGPKIAALFEKGKIFEVERMLQKVTTGLFILGFIPFLLYLFAGKTILSFWGDEFSDAYWLLIILSLGQLIKIGTGPVAQLLIMTGHHKENTYITVSFMLVHLILNIVLIKFYGIIGAALATSFTIAGTSITRIIIAKQKTNILTIRIK